MLLIVLIACLSTTTANNATKDDIEQTNNSTKELLSASETSDPGKAEIVKQIRKLNDDGSYTIGYEADDGTFKIESRDVRGNVKGTFGYVDKDGEVKRVTYSTSSDSTPVPVTTSTTVSTPTSTVRVDKTVSSTTRRPLATVVYPTRSSHTTKSPVVQSIPRRRTTLPSTRTTTNVIETTTEKQEPLESGSNILNLYRSKSEDSGRTRTQILNPISKTVSDDLVTKQTTTHSPYTIKPVYENPDEGDEIEPNKANTKRRELSGTSPNPHMISLQQSAGDDSTDVYGNHLSLGTVRPLFTTTTPRARLVPIQSIVAARQRIQNQYRENPVQEQETTIEASTGRVFDHDRVVTSNPVPVIHIPAAREHEERAYEQPLYRRPTAAIHFRTQEYLRDNPGAAIPIGNMRPFLQFDYQNKVLEPQYVKEAPATQNNAAQATQSYEVRPVTRVIPIPVDERGVPIPGYPGRLVNPYRPPQTYQPRFENVIDEMNSISAPVSTRDLKRLLQILILRQNRLQSLMDQIVAPGPPYQPLPLFSQNYDYNRHQPRQYQDENYDYRYDQQQYNQDYQNQGSYDNPQYDSQRYMPRRRLYTRPAYDTVSSSSNRVEEGPEFLPAEIREALLLKMLMLAISPDLMPSPAPPTELTTAAPTRKQVRNVQILGEEGVMEAKRSMRRH